jgi:hypothetical protein
MHDICGAVRCCRLDPGCRKCSNTMLLLTQCAACAAPLGLTSGKKCGRCSTRYCGPECQVQHWKEGGHDQLCKPIKKAGGAEQFHANKKYTESVTIAAAACADDTKGQTCYICTQALHWKTKEGLVRMCACRGTAGFAHVSCLAEQAQILFAEAEENNLDPKVQQARWDRWHTCGLCEQRYHGPVIGALGWACWKTYLGRPETDTPRIMAMNVLGGGLHGADHNEDELSVREAELSLHRRYGSESAILTAQSSLANTYQMLGRHEEALHLRRDVYSAFVRIHGEGNGETLLEACNYTLSLLALKHLEESKSLMRKTVPVARRVLGESNEITLRMRWNYASALCQADGATLDDLREAVTTLKDAARIARRVLGGAYPITVGIGQCLLGARAALRARETGDMSAIREAVEALTTGDA